jgi:hypothetical protein
MIIMGCYLGRLRSELETHENYYAIDPRGVGRMVEKLEKNPPCNAKFEKLR